MPSPLEEMPIRQVELPPVASVVTRQWPWQVIFLGLCGVLCVCSFALDDTAIFLIEKYRWKPWRDLAGTLSDHGDWPWLMLGAVMVLLWAAWKKRTGLMRLMLIAMLSSSVAGTVTNSLRLTTGRTRPDNKKAAPGWYGLRHDGKWLLGARRFSSFPSAHTATAFGFFAPIALRRKRWSFLWFLPGIIMAASRMTINAHHLSDVCFGGWIGLLSAWWVGRSPRLEAVRKWKPGWRLPRKKL